MHNAVLASIFVTACFFWTSEAQSIQCYSCNSTTTACTNIVTCTASSAAGNSTNSTSSSAYCYSTATQVDCDSTGSYCSNGTSTTTGGVQCCSTSLCNVLLSNSSSSANSTNSTGSVNGTTAPFPSGDGNSGVQWLVDGKLLILAAIAQFMLANVLASK